MTVNQELKFVGDRLPKIREEGTERFFVLLAGINQEKSCENAVL